MKLTVNHYFKPDENLKSWSGFIGALGIIVYIAENIYFGWHAQPQSTAESIADNIVVILCGIGIALLAMSHTTHKKLQIDVIAEGTNLEVDINGTNIKEVDREYKQQAEQQAPPSKIP